MKKITPQKKHVGFIDKTSTIVNEPMAMYITTSLKKITLTTEFTYKKFQKIVDKVPFTQKEWSNILHLSERTLQRYSKMNSPFQGIYVDRILQLDELITQGLDAFESPASLYAWLKKEKQVLGYTLNFESLFSTQGIQLIHNEIGRILHGVYI